MKDIMRKIGRTIVAFLPVPACFLLQFVVMMAAEVIILFPVILQSMMGSTGVEDLNQVVNEQVMGNIMTLQIVAQVAMLVVFGLWYYLAYGRKKRPDTAEKPQGKHVGLIISMGLILQLGISSVLCLIQIMAPKALESYNELMELAGLTEMSIPVMIAVSVMAPLSEEVLCRGVILRLAERVSPRFWVANVIQALAFGILHGNLVQGTYAFVLGLLLGYVYGKFRNIWLCMLLHASMNLSSFIVDPFYSLFPEEGMPAAFIAVLLVSAALFVVCIKPFAAERQEVN